MKTLNYSTITLNQLEEIFDIEKNYDRKIFDKWFFAEDKISEEDKIFLDFLLKKHINKIVNYTELELISKFIAPILNRIDFELEDADIRDFYETPLKYRIEDITFNGRCDYVVAKGYSSPIEPYFFIQEFKQASASFPEEQLLAEMIVATYINNTTTIKGAYIMGYVWTFVFLEKIEDKKYKYHISKKYDATDSDDLYQIYKNLQVVKREIYESH